MSPRSGFRSGGTWECILVPVFRSGGTSERTLVPVSVPGEHPPKPPFWKPPFWVPPSVFSSEISSASKSKKRFGVYQKACFLGKRRKKKKTYAPKSLPGVCGEKMSVSSRTWSLLLEKTDRGMKPRSGKKKEQKLRAACLQNETALEKLLNRYEKRFEKREKRSEK